MNLNEINELNGINELEKSKKKKKKVGHRLTRSFSLIKQRDTGTQIDRIIGEAEVQT